VWEASTPTVSKAPNPSTASAASSVWEASTPTVSKAPNPSTASTASRAQRELDVVLHGASGFTGRLVAAHLAAHAPAGVRVGLSGRSADRVAAVRRGLGPVAVGWPVLVADAADPTALAALAGRTRVVLSTVGPYARHGLPLVAACAAAGTDYADLTGEVTFVRRSIDAHHETAVASGARIVHACGFDSVPSDLGVLLLHERALADGAGGLTDTTYVLTDVRGGISGGTLESLRGLLDDARDDPEARRVIADRYALSPDRDGEPDRDGDIDSEPDSDGEPDRDSSTMAVHRDDSLGGWVGPFAMAAFDTRVVRRSNALQGWAYGRSLRYREVVGFGSGPAAPVVAQVASAAVGLGVLGLSRRPTRALLDRVLPRAGSGPSERTRRNGRFRVEISTRTTSGRRYTAVVAGRGDPGYAATAVLLGESGLCLALDRDRLPPGGGVLTPATALGDALADRLRAAGLTLEVQER